MPVERGICRTVLLVGSWAIKVPTTRPYGRRGNRLWAFCRGYLANESELAWSKVKGVAPVVWHLGALIVCFRRAAPVTNLPGQEDDAFWRSIAPDFPASDRKPENVGWLDGRLVWVDYDLSWNGCPHQEVRAE